MSPSAHDVGDLSGTRSRLRPRCQRRRSWAWPCFGWPHSGRLPVTGQPARRSPKTATGRLRFTVDTCHRQLAAWEQSFEPQRRQLWVFSSRRASLAV